MKAFHKKRLLKLADYLETIPRLVAVRIRMFVANKGIPI